QNVLRQYEWGRLLLEQTITWENILREQSVLLERVTGIFSSTVGAIISLAIIVFLGFYLAIQPNLYIQGFLHLFPLNNRERMHAVLEECGQTLQWWLLGRAISMVSVGTMISIGLGIMGIPLAMALGFLAALLDFIPNIGPVVATLPAVIIALGQDPVKALYVLILYFVIQQIENYLITPIIQQRTVDLPPALTIVAQVLLTVILGAFGLLIASPLMAVLIVIVRMLYVEDILGDRFPPPEKKDRWLRIIRLKVSNIRANEKSTPPEADTPN
ncbi:MAG: AI-2E family transporter, partial [Anaerolineaceae bacterium]|nr:AI-2E family transporter [Anaerolineaceae bacterium]